MLIDWKERLKTVWERFVRGGPREGSPGSAAAPAAADETAEEVPAELPCLLDYRMARKLLVLAWRQCCLPEDLASDLIRYALARREAILEVQRQVIAENRRSWQSLTPRQRQVAALACQRSRSGRPLTNQQIASRLGVSVETVKAHLSAVLEKFDVVNRTELRIILDGWDFTTGEPGPRFHLPGMYSRSGRTDGEGSVIFGGGQNPNSPRPGGFGEF